MALEITFIISEAQKSRVIDAFCLAFDYQEEIPDPENPGETIPNPESKGEMVKRKIARHIKDVVRAQELNAATAASREEYVDVEVT